MTSLTDTRLHLWTIAAERLDIGTATQHGVCGVHIGHFTSKPDEVTCSDCIDIINLKELYASQAEG